jgi:hypothetical protein
MDAKFKISDIISFGDDIYQYKVLKLDLPNQSVTSMIEVKKPNDHLPDSKYNTHNGNWRFEDMILVKRKMNKDMRPEWY